MKVNNNNGISGNGNSTDINNISLFDGKEFKSPSSFSGPESTKPIQVSPIQGEILTMEVNNNNGISGNGNSTDINNISLFDGKEFPSPSSFSGPESTKPIKISPIRGENPCNHVWNGPIKVPNIFDGDDQYYYVCSSCKMKVPTYEISTTNETGKAYRKNRRITQTGNLNQQKR